MSRPCCKSLGALLKKVIDYAGLFPPARLPLDETLANYLDYRGSAFAWIVGRFLCPIARFEEAAALYSERGGDAALPISLIAGAVEDPREALEALASDLDTVDRAVSSHDNLSVEVLELKLPASLVLPSKGTTLKAFLERADRILADHARTPREGYWEIPRGRGWSETLREAAATLRSLNSRGRARGPLWGLKLRCGGLSPSDFPGTKEVATALETSFRFRVPFKATAGLHQPLPHPDRETGAEAQGFLNLFAGAILLGAGKLSPSELPGVLTAADPQQFGFDENELRREDRAVSLDEISAGRKIFTSFGSCSILEPMDELARLGLLDEKGASRQGAAWAATHE